jgi:hypothetical protein
MESRLLVLKDRWFSVVFFAVLTAVAGVGLYQQLFILPGLTAQRTELWIAGADARAEMYVDENRSLTALTGGLDRIQDLLIFGDTMYVHASDVGVEGESGLWVLVPLNRVSEEFRALMPDRVRKALTVGFSSCTVPAANTRAVLTLSLPALRPSVRGDVICGAKSARIVDPGKAFIAEPTRIRPRDITPPPANLVVLLDSVPDPERVVSALNDAIAGNG